jgi:hypothetical protein
MKLKVGKTYMRRQSKKLVTITHKTISGLWPFVGDDGNYYKEDGMWLDTESSMDLIAEAPTPTNPS